MYKVTIAGETVGYIYDIEAFKNSIDEKIYNEEEKEYMAFYTINEEPVYKAEYVDKKTENNDDEIINKIKENTVATYLAYEITVNDETKAYVSSMEEAEEIVSDMKQEIEDEELEMSIGIAKKYTEDKSTLDISNKEEVEKEIDSEIEKAIEIKGATVNGVYLGFTPVKGTYISSRYGDTEGRGSGHGGLDIAAPNGTPIYACGDGVVKLASNSYYGYGNLVIIDHGNGVETYYGHCSKLNVTKGQEVKAGDLIANVGATGQATGPHLHLEVRINGATVNPQRYLYK